MGSEVLSIAHLKKISWFSVSYNNLFIFKSFFFVLTMTIFGVSDSAKDLDIPCLVKLKGSMTFLSDLVNFKV